jgi:hypothetical protein
MEGWVYIGLVLRYRSPVSSICIMDHHSSGDDDADDVRELWKGKPITIN